MEVVKELLEHEGLEIKEGGKGELEYETNKEV